MKPPEWKGKRQDCYGYCLRLSASVQDQVTGAEFWCFLQQQVPLKEWETHSCTVLLATIKTQDSQHPGQATWEIHREDLLDYNYDLPYDEDNRAQGTPPTAAHSTSVTPFLIKEV